MKLPNIFHWVSLPYLLIGALLLGSGLFYICLRQRAYVLFGLTAIFAAGYALASSVAYSSANPGSTSFWIHMQFAFSVPLVLFFGQFSANHLGFFNKFYKWVFPAISLFFLPQFLITGWMLQTDLHYQTFKLGSTLYSMPRLPLGIGGIILIAWYLLNALVLGWFWFGFIFREGHDFSLLLAFLVFVSTGVFDLGIVSGFYQGPFIFVFGFCGLLFAMGYQLLSNYMLLSQQYQERTQEVQKVNDEMRNLVETIAHDIRAPLVSIDGFIDILESTPPEGRQGKNYFERIRANADHMKNLLEDFAEFLRVGRVRDSIQEVDVHKVIQQAVTMLEVPTKFPRATVEVAESWPSWTGSAKRLQQIVVNLVQNSFTHGRRVNLHIYIYGKAKKGGLELIVEDNGPGIPPHLRETVFQPFFRYSPETQGTGLGLSIVQKMARSLGGDAWVDKEFTEGARIRVQLPGQVLGEND